MKFITISLISFYQMILSPNIRALVGIQHSCRFTLSCSEYAKQNIRSYGFLRGSSLAIKRLLSCHPFGTIH